MILAYSPVLVLFVGAYGSEGILRVYLFSLPWAVCLAASALKPVSLNQGRLGVLLVPLVLVTAIALFLPSFFGDDSSYEMSKSEVQGVLAFYRSALPGTIFGADSNFPSQISGRYNLFGEKTLYGQGGIVAGPNSLSSNGIALTQAIEDNDPKPDEPVYVLITPSMQAYGTANGFLHPHELRDLSQTLNNTQGWFRDYNSQGLTVFELPPIA
jgi:hypothetical protein